MWKAAAGTQININHQDNNEDDDWETDPDFVNDVSEQEQRWGSATIEGSGRTAGAIDMDKLRRETEESDAIKKKKAFVEGPNASFGYGGKFGVEKDRMDKSALGHDHIEKLQKHASQKDYSTGFGGKFGVQTDRVDKSAVNWDHKEKVEKHTSQKDYVTGFGGKFGVQSDRQDKSAVGWDHVEKVDKHESQKDYSVGFGGKFGVQSDRQDKSAVGWDHHEAPQKHESQTDHKIGFGGKFGVQTDRMDKSAMTFAQEQSKVGTTYNRVKPDIGAAKPSEMRAKFEIMNSQEDGKPPSQLGSPAPKKSVHAKAAMFINKPEEAAVASPERMAPRHFDQSKTAFLQQQTAQPEQTHTVEKAPGQLDKSKLMQFTEQKPISSSETSRNKIKDEIEELKRSQPQPEMEEFVPTRPQIEVKEMKQIQPLPEVKELKQTQPQFEVNEMYQTQPQFEAKELKREQLQPESLYDVVEQEDDYDSQVFYETLEPTIPEEVQEDEIVDTGLTAVALYDYQAAAEDEISFDPEDLITHVEMIDEGWWRGMCKGRYGLFPANYVQLQQR